MPPQFEQPIILDDCKKKESICSDIAATVLVIDDELINLEVMQGMLASLAIQSEQAMSGAQALTLIQKRIQKVEQGDGEMYKFVLLDFSMPEMDGP